MKVVATKGILLARVSTKEQFEEEKGHLSIPEQLDKGRKYAQESGIDITGREKKFYESGFKGKRTKFNKALKEALDIVEQEEEPVALLFNEVTRFTRRWDEVLKLDELRKDGKIELHFFGQGLVIHRNSKALELGSWEQWCAYARQDSLVKSGRTKDSFKSNLARNRFPGCLPTGYLKGGEWDPERQPLIREAFEIYSQNNLSVQELTEIMAEKGLTTKPSNGEAKPVTKSNMLYILNNQTYTGKKDWLNPETGERDTLYEFENFEPIIPEELFKKVQDIINEKSIRYSTRHSTAKFFKFRGILTCGYCGCALTPNDLSTNYKDKKPGEEVYYRCSYSKKAAEPDYYLKRFGKKHSGVRKRKGKEVYNCPQMYWSEKEIEERIKEELGHIVYDKKMFDQLRQEIHKRFEAEVKLPQESIKTLNKNIEELKRLQAGYLRDMAMAEQAGIKEELVEQVVFTKQRIAEMKKEIADWEKVIDIQVDETMDSMVLASNLVEQYGTLTPMRQRFLVQAAFSEISLRKGQTMMKVGGKKKLVGMDDIAFRWNEDFRDNLDRAMEKMFRKEVKAGRMDADQLKRFQLQRKQRREEEEALAKTANNGGNKDLTKKNITRERLSGHGFSPQERRAKP